MFALCLKVPVTNDSGFLPYPELMLYLSLSVPSCVFTWVPLSLCVYSGCFAEWKHYFVCVCVRKASAFCSFSTVLTLNPLNGTLYRKSPGIRQPH